MVFRRNAQLSFKWTLGQKLAVNYAIYKFTIQQDHLTLALMGCVLVIWYLVLHFLAILHHRMGTILMLISCSKWQREENTEDALLEKYAAEIVKELQSLNTDGFERRELDEQHVSRRKTLHNLERARVTKQSVINLDANFKRRFTMLQNNDSGDANIK